MLILHWISTWDSQKMAMLDSRDLMDGMLVFLFPTSLNLQMSNFTMEMDCIYYVQRRVR